MTGTRIETQKWNCVHFDAVRECTRPLRIHAIVTAFGDLSKAPDWNGGWCSELDRTESRSGLSAIRRSTRLYTEAM